MTKILIAGYYGFNNIGDEAILQSIITRLRKKVEHIDITVLSANHKVTSDRYNVQAVDRRNLSEIIKAIKKCDLLIVGGGSLLQDVTSKRSIYYYLTIIFLAIINNKKVMMHSQGIGPINKEVNRKVTSWLLNKVEYITVRDKNSERELIEMGINKDKIAITTDPVIGLEQVDNSLGLNILKNNYKNIFDSNKKTIGFAFRDWKDKAKIREVLVDTVKIIKNSLDVNIVFIPFHYDEDIKIINDISDELKDQAIFIKEKYNLNEMTSIISNLDLLVGVRLHSLIFAAVTDVPMIAISYDPKINYFMYSLGLDVFSDIENLDSGSLADHIIEICNTDKYDINTFRQNFNKIKDTLDVNEKIIVDIAKKLNKSR